jgi:hypothetical protein
MAAYLNFQKKFERDVTYKTTFVIALSVFCPYLLKIYAIVAYIFKVLEQLNVYFVK